MGLYQSESLKLCEKKIHEIDVTLRALGSSSSFDKIYKRIIISLTIPVLFIFLFFATIILKMVLETNSFYKSPLLYLFAIQYIYAFMIEYLLVYEFFVVVRCVQLEFKRANDLLSDVNILPINSIASELIERSFHVDSNKLFDLSSSLHKMHSRLQVASHKLNRSRKLLRTIRQVHLELCKLSKCFSMIFGIQISLEMVMCILCNTYSLYNFYSSYSEESKKSYGLIFLFITTILSFLPYLTRIFFITCICDRTTKEADRTKEIIHTFYANNTDCEIQREVEIFSLQMMQCRTAFTAFGFYNLDCKRIGSCIGVITTYLVILIQVSDSIRKES
ncbi:hypothetical protein M0804_011305 [Polistes exclamans]|nr:hypothetical protein M0804_011305 [Polistes exclamans]